MTSKPVSFELVSAVQIIFLIFLWTAMAPSALADRGDGIIDPGEVEIAELARAVQNPVASLISLPIQNNTTFKFGPQEKVQNVANVQPVWPFEINENWNLITRTIGPVISQPAFVPSQDRENGIRDTVFTAFASPSKFGKWIWGAGAAANFPGLTQ